MSEEKRIGVYVRVSSDEQGINGFGLDVQREKLLQYCQFKDWTNLSWFEDTCSGGSMKRPGLRKLLRKIKKGELDIVLTYRADRLSRKLSDLLRMIEESFEANGVVFISATEEFNSGTATGKAVISLLGTFAELERNTIKERTIGGKQVKARRGGYVTGNCPLGYSTHNKTLIVDEKGAETVRLIYVMHKEGKSLNQIARDLNADKVHGAKGKKWYPSSIGYILRNQIYQGILRQTIEGEVYQSFVPSLKIL